MLKLGTRKIAGIVFLISLILYVPAFAQPARGKGKNSNRRRDKSQQQIASQRRTAQRSSAVKTTRNTPARKSRVASSTKPRAERPRLRNRTALRQQAQRQAQRPARSHVETKKRARVSNFGKKKTLPWRNQSRKHNELKQNHLRAKRNSLRTTVRTRSDNIAPEQKIDAVVVSGNVQTSRIASIGRRNTRKKGARARRDGSRRYKKRGSTIRTITQRPREKKGKTNFILNISSGRNQHRRRAGNRRRRIFKNVVWPKYRCAIYYNWGPRFTFRYVHPYHHQKYVFVSIGGYWPAEYNYLRYYRYGYHPYYWYGQYPQAYEVTYDNDNYYTYNYNYYPQAPAGQPTEFVPADNDQFYDALARAKSFPDKAPGAETKADLYFEDGVQAFEARDYEKAAEMFAEAVDLEPDDIVLPFTYVQALFAKQQYDLAAEVLREAILNIPADTEGIFFPRGLYPDDNILFEQIGRLAQRADSYQMDADLQLLLGYQLLGAGEFEQARGPLEQVGINSRNTKPAAILLDLLAKIQETTPEND